MRIPSRETRIRQLKQHRLAFAAGFIAALFMSMVFGFQAVSSAAALAAAQAEVQRLVDASASFAHTTKNTPSVTTPTPPTTAQPAENLPPSTEWWTVEELNLLSKVVTLEAGGTQNDEVMQGVAAVVLNRMQNYPDQFGSTIHEVIHRQGQYPTTVQRLPDTTPTERAIENTLVALRGEDTFPEDIVWQAEFPQAAFGTETDVYKVFDTSPNKTYFCHYGKES